MCWGTVRYLLLYLASGVVGGAVPGAARCHFDGADDRGVSGAIAGVLGAYLMLYPFAKVHVLMWIVIFVRIVAVPAWIMLGLWFGLQLLGGLLSDPAMRAWRSGPMSAASSAASCCSSCCGRAGCRCCGRPDAELRRRGATQL